MADFRLKGVRSFLAIAVGTLFLTALVQSQNFVPNELIVKFRSDAPDSVLNQVLINKDFSAVASRSYTPSIKKISSLSAVKKSSPVQRKCAVSNLTPAERFTYCTYQVCR